MCETSALFLFLQAAHSVLCDDHAALTDSAAAQREAMETELAGVRQRCSELTAQLDMANYTLARAQAEAKTERREAQSSQAKVRGLQAHATRLGALEKAVQLLHDKVHAECAPSGVGVGVGVGVMGVAAGDTEELRGSARAHARAPNAAAVTTPARPTSQPEAAIEVSAGDYNEGLVSTDVSEASLVTSAGARVERVERVENGSDLSANQSQRDEKDKYFDNAAWRGRGRRSCCPCWPVSRLSPASSPSRRPSDHPLIRRV